MFDLLLLIDDLYVSVGHFAADPACIGMRLLILKVLQMLFTAMRSWHQPPETGRIEMDVEEQIRAHAEKEASKAHAISMDPDRDEYKLSLCLLLATG